MTPAIPGSGHLRSPLEKLLSEELPGPPKALRWERWELPAHGQGGSPRVKPSAAEPASLGVGVQAPWYSGRQGGPRKQGQRRSPQPCPLSQSALFYSFIHSSIHDLMSSCSGRKLRIQGRHTGQSPCLPEAHVTVTPPRFPLRPPRACRPQCLRAQKNLQPQARPPFPCLFSAFPTRMGVRRAGVSSAL